jgi:hypothetical protein
MLSPCHAKEVFEFRTAPPHAAFRYAGGVQVPLPFPSVKRLRDYPGKAARLASGQLPVAPCVLRVKQGLDFFAFAFVRNRGICKGGHGLPGFGFHRIFSFWL